ncbi:hypothetical protein [Streptacidiphilus sp. EB103A]|uniref:hypothetical protein n=1 Tax=Streptacidiphilus sp. EB103A TaxID=3156275 RepID=UPI003516DDC2
MTTFRVTTPVPGFTGDVGAISFVKGHAFVSDDDNDAALIYFRGQGYLVEDIADLPAEETVGAGDAARVTELEAENADLKAQLAAATPSDPAKGASK